MKRILMAVVLAALMLPIDRTPVQAGEVDVLLFKLVEKGILTPSEAQIITDETKLQVSKDLAQGKSLSVPDWTQRIKWGGDVRFRTQGDWGNPVFNSNNNSSALHDQRIRERVRGRFYMEGKANDFTYAGVRFAGGDVKSNSTNDTLDAYFNKKYAMFDQYYIRFEAPPDLVRDYGQYFSDVKLWLGKFQNPFESSELVWDTDINPGGIALQYTSPDIKLGSLPAFNVYTNDGMFWLDEMIASNADPLLFVFQGGLKTDTFGPLGSTLNAATSIYNFSNLKGKTPSTASVSAGTNTRTKGGGNATGPGAYAYEYNVFDLLIQLDNAKVMDMEFPHGFYADFIHNPSVPEQGNGALVGAYIGKKKIKVPGDWKARAEWRYIERDSIPDFMPDSDFYGFGTFTVGQTGLNAGNNGLGKENGTNGKGINLCLDYQLLKNTSVSLEYYWMKPIKSWDKTQPWNECQFDIITKF
ncbi:MAG: putative porin [Candidatus Omnitrophota bacterium]|jgi:hypothetical protein